MTAKSWHCRPASHSQVDNNNNNNSKLWSSINGQLVTTRYKMQFWSTIHFWSAKAAFMFTLTAVFPLTSARLTWVGLPSKDVVLLATSLLPPSTTSSQPSLVTPTPNTSSSPEFFLGQKWVLIDLRPCPSPVISLPGVVAQRWKVRLWNRATTESTRTWSVKVF